MDYTWKIVIIAVLAFATAASVVWALPKYPLSRSTPQKAPLIFRFSTRAFKTPILSALWLQLPLFTIFDTDSTWIFVVAVGICLLTIKTLFHISFCTIPAAIIGLFFLNSSSPQYTIFYLIYFILCVFLYLCFIKTTYCIANRTYYVSMFDGDIYLVQSDDE